MSRGRSGSVWTRAPAAAVPWVRLFVCWTSDSSFSSIGSAVTRFVQASWCICLRFGRLPSRHAFGRRLGLSIVRDIAGKLAPRRGTRTVRSTGVGPFPARSGRDASHSRGPIRGLACDAFCPIGCELRNVAKTACSISRKFSPGCSDLDRRCLGELAFQDVGPVLLVPLVLLARGDVGQFACRLGDALWSGAGRNTFAPTSGRPVPLLGVPQRQGERPQDAPRPLEAVELGPLRVEDVGQVRVERDSS